MFLSLAICTYNGRKVLLQNFKAVGQIQAELYTSLKLNNFIHAKDPILQSDHICMVQLVVIIILIITISYRVSFKCKHF